MSFWKIQVHDSVHDDGALHILGDSEYKNLTAANKNRIVKSKIKARLQTTDWSALSLTITLTDTLTTLLPPKVLRIPSTIVKLNKRLEHPIHPKLPVHSFDQWQILVAVHTTIPHQNLTISTSRTETCFNHRPNHNPRKPYWAQERI